MLQPVELTSSDPPPADLPSNWESHVYQLDRSAALDLGFTVGSVKATGRTGLLVMDTARTKEIRRGRRTERWGCGYRLVIEISDVDLVAKLSLPAIAASAEVSSAAASITLEVKGYKGDDLWDVIPPPAPLDVDSYRTYLDSAANIQRRFKDNPSNQVAVLLARSEGRFDILLDGLSDQDLDSAVTAAWALRGIAHGASLAQALEDFPGEAGLSEIVEHTYRNIRGDRFDSPNPPDETEQAKARAHADLLDTR
jgi:hypothetical protein